MKDKSDLENQNETNDKETKKKSGVESGLEALVLVPQLGLAIAIPIVLGAYAGHWLDGKLGTGMIFTVILLCLGIAGGVFNAYWQV
ncbi:MAG: AtpZ/AtpI family protein, partial [Bacillota bacterium]